MKHSLIILFSFLIGLWISTIDVTPEWFKAEKNSEYMLYLLMFFIGVGIGADRKAWQLFKRPQLKMFIVPFVAILGTLIGAVAIFPLVSTLSLRETIAVSMGLGYYSLSSILVTEIGGEELGVVMLLSNVLREIITLVATPLLVRHFGKLSGVVAGGVTAMDTALPIIIRYSGKEWAVISIFSGILLTILVPFLLMLVL